MIGWQRAYGMGGQPWAVGETRGGRFRVRCVRFGKLHATYERRKGEQIKPVLLFVAADRPSVREEADGAR